MSCVQSVLKDHRHYCRAAIPLSAPIAVMALLAGQTYASCWAQNPIGQRKCGYFRSSASNLDLWLCEDKEDDCANLGYAPLKKTHAQLAIQSPENKPTLAPPVKSSAVSGVIR